MMAVRKWWCWFLNLGNRVSLKQDPATDWDDGVESFPCPALAPGGWQALSRFSGLQASGLVTWIGKVSEEEGRIITLSIRWLGENK